MLFRGQQLTLGYVPWKDAVFVRAPGCAVVKLSLQQRLHRDNSKHCTAVLTE